MVGLYTFRIPLPDSSNAARTFSANGHDVLAPAVSPPPQFDMPESGGLPLARIGLALCLRGLGRLTVIVVVAGADPAALATTSMVLAPRCSGTDPAKTPLPTCTDLPRICTAASDGVTVPLTATRSARTELPSAGAVISTFTLALAPLVFEPPQAAMTKTRRLAAAMSANLIPNRWGGLMMLDPNPGRSRKASARAVFRTVQVDE